MTAAGLNSILMALSEARRPLTHLNLQGTYFVPLPDHSVAEQLTKLFNVIDKQ